MRIVFLSRPGSHSLGLVNRLFDERADTQIDAITSTNGLQQVVTSAADRESIDAVVIDESPRDVVRSVQRLKSMLGDASVVVLCDSQQHAVYQNSLAQSPFAGAHVSLVSTADQTAVLEAIEGAARRTRQRRKYHRMLADSRIRVATLARPKPQPSQMLDRLLDAAPMGVLILNSQRQITAVNRYGRVVLDGMEQQLIGSRLDEYFPTQERSALNQLLDAGRKSGKQLPPQVFERSRDQKQNRRWTEVTVGAVPGRHAGDNFAMVILQDVTERHLATAAQQQLNQTLEQRVEQRTAALQAAGAELASKAEQLEREKYLLDTLVESIPDPVFFKDRDGRFIRVNRAMAENAGVENADELIGKTDADIWPLKMATETASDERRILLTGEPLISKEEHTIAQDGSDRWVLVTKMPLRNETGIVVGTFGIAREITERKRLEIQVEASKKVAEDSERRLRVIFESTANGMLLVDRGGKIVMVNSELEKLFGYSRDELIGKKVELLVPERVRATHQGLRDQFSVNPVSRGMGEGRDLAGLHRDGREIPVEIGLSSVSTDEGVFVLASVTDITERKRHEQELINSRDAAEAANRAKSAFLANMSHEIRTPMNGILGMAELLQRSELSPRQREFVTAAHDSAQALLRLLNELLDLSRIEAGRMELDCEDFSINDCVARAMRTLAPAADAKNLELTCRIAPNVPSWVRGDAGRLRQVLVNLIGNAVKFTDSGEVDVEVSVADEGLDPNRLSFSVSDTGPGIPLEHQQRIFDSFEQADMSNTRRFGGSGLGLAVSSKLVDLMNGRIWVESEPGHGATFRFTARFKASTAESRASTLNSESRLAQYRDLSGLPVLVVDDNATNRMILEELLHQWHFAPVLAEEGPTAVNLFRQASRDGRPYRLVLLDYNMPEMNGFQVAERLAGDTDWKDCTVIMLSSSLAPDEAQRNRELGIDRLLTKPVIASELLNVVLDHLADHRYEQPGASDQGIRAMRRRILLVEDSKVNQMVILEFLNSRNDESLVVENGKEALELLQRESFDVVLMDMQMPIMDGYEAITNIRAGERGTNRHQAIISLTAEAMKGDRERCLAVGADDYVSKPVNLEQLHRVLDRMPADYFADQQKGNDAMSELRPDASDEVTPSAADAELRQIDLSHARKAIPGGDKGIKNLAAICADECRSLLPQLEQAIQNRDAALIRRLAHTVKGATRYFGATQVGEAAFALETIGRDGRLDEAPQAFVKLKPAAERLIAELDALLKD